MPDNTQRPDVSVTVGMILPDDTDGKFLESDDPKSIYDDYVISNRYESDGHVYMLGITSPDGFSPSGGSQKDTVAFVKLAGKTLLWICDWTVMRRNQKPKIPNPASNNPNWVLLDDHWEPFMENISADAKTPVWRISGTYIYGHKNPKAATYQDIAFPRPAWLEDFTSRDVPSTMLEGNLSEIANEFPQGGVIGLKGM